MTDAALESVAAAAVPPRAAGCDVRAADPAHDERHDRFVDAHAQGSVFHLAGWSRAVARVFDHERADLHAWCGERLAGVLPLTRCATITGGAHLISVPYGVYGGPLAESPEVERALVEAAVRLAEREKAGRLELRCVDEPAGSAELGLVPHDLYATFVQDVPADPALVLKEMPKRARAEVRKAREEFGLDLSEGPWYLDDLARLFHSSKKGLGSPGLPASWFAALCEELGPRVLIHAVHKESEVVAATMSFVHAGVFSLYYIGTSDAGNRTYRATNFVCAGLQELSARRGLARFDLGRSRVDSGPYHFKKHQGFEPKALAYRLKLVKSRSKPTFNPSNPRTKVLREAWTRLPDGLTRRLSTVLSRYLP